MGVLRILLLLNLIACKQGLTTPQKGHKINANDIDFAPSVADADAFLARVAAVEDAEVVLA